MIHPAAKLEQYVDSVRKEQQVDEEDKPHVYFSRHTSYANEPCSFCERAGQIREVLGRYYTIEPSEDEEDDGKVGVYFCGDCLNLLEQFAECDME